MNRKMKKNPLWVWVLLCAVSIFNIGVAWAESSPVEREMMGLHTTFNHKCTKDAECVQVRATCSSCSCSSAAVHKDDYDNYAKARIALCSTESAGEKANCDMNCPVMLPKCIKNQCALEPAAQP